MVIPKPGSLLRGLATLCGVLIFLWLTPEDNHLLPVVLLSIFATVILLSLWITGRFGGYSLPRWWLPLIGMVAGLGANMTTVVLMLVKNAQHSHTFPDFPPGVFVGIIERAPVWIIAGALVGLSFSLALLASRNVTVGGREN